MRAVVHLDNYDPDTEEIVHEQHRVRDPQSAADNRAVIDGVHVEWYPGGGNIHVTDLRAEEVSEMADGSVLVLLEDDEVRIENAELVTVRRD